MLRIVAALMLTFAGPVYAQPSDDGFERDVERFVREFVPGNKRLSDGLPPELPGDYGSDGSFLDFDHLQGIRPPLGLRIRLNGRNATTGDLAATFKDEHAVRLPAGSRIRRLLPGTHEELWDFPEGTRLFHKISLKDAAGTLFEFRLLERQPDGKWSYGTYLKAADGKLRLVQVQEEGSYQTVLADQPVLIELTRLPPESCRNCHAARSVNRYPDPEKAGPCGFGPGHPTARTAWAEAFRARFGHDPFLD